MMTVITGGDGYCSGYNVGLIVVLVMIVVVLIMG